MTTRPDGVLEPLITVDQVADEPDRLRLCDLRWHLTEPGRGRSVYEMGHIPGAVFVDLDVDLADTPGDRGRHPLPDPADFAAVLGRLGITPETHVVVYDDMGGQVAARLWWMLRSIGHDKVQLLDGGYRAWVASGRDVGVGTVSPEPTRYPTPPGFSGVVSADQLVGRSLIDARATERYRGDFEPVDPRAGHIPGAVNIPSSENLAEDARFHSHDRLREVYAGIPEHPVMSCGSGVTACHNALALVIAGHEMPDVYVGSFSEWSRQGRPITTGDRP